MRTREATAALIEGRLSSQAGRSELVELATQLIIREALEGEVRDALDRGYYERGEAPSQGHSLAVEMLARLLSVRDIEDAFKDEDMRHLGVGDPLLVVSDGAPGVIKAIEVCFPRSTRQRCLAHRMRNRQGPGGSLARV